MRWRTVVVLGIGVLFSTNYVWSSTYIDDHTDFISRRWYLVDRLTKPMKLIAKLYQHHASQLLPLDLPVPVLLTDPVVQSRLQLVMSGKTITPVLDLWQHIRSYKYVNQPTLPADFVVLVCILLRHCFVTLPQFHNQEICDQILIPYEKLLSWDTVQILDLIGRVTNYLKGKKFACLVNHRASVGLLPRYLDIMTRDISLRFCLSSRLKKTFDWLSLFKNKKVSFFKNMITRDQATIIVDAYVSLEHPRMVTCCREMAQTESLAPFIALWKQFCTFEEIHDVQFLKDFLKLVFVTYHYLFLGNLVKKNEPVGQLMQEMNGWSVHLNEFSVMQILDVIDVIEHSCYECKITMDTKQPQSWLDTRLQQMRRGWQKVRGAVLGLPHKEVA